jgi:hypothetical protein
MSIINPPYPESPIKDYINSLSKYGGHMNDYRRVEYYCPVCTRKHRIMKDRSVRYRETKKRSSVNNKVCEECK